MSCLVIPDLRVQAANMHHAQIAVGGPPIVAAYGFAHALCLQAELGVQVTGFAYIHRNIQPLGTVFYGVFHPQQRRAASFSYTPSLSADYSSRNRHALSLQPTASAHLNLSLVIETDRPVAGTRPVEAWLGSARFAGGTVIGHRPVWITGDIEEAFTEGDIGTGFVVLDRRDLLEMSEEGSDPATLMVRALGTAIGQGPSWLAATSVGYAAITDFEPRAGARMPRRMAPGEPAQRYLHAFAEPLVGLVQHKSLRDFDSDGGEIDEMFWRPQWLQDDVFVLQQSLPVNRADADRLPPVSATPVSA